MLLLPLVAIVMIHHSEAEKQQVNSERYFALGEIEDMAGGRPFIWPTKRTARPLLRISHESVDYRLMQVQDARTTKPNTPSLLRQTILWVVAAPILALAGAFSKRITSGFTSMFEII